jgi:hypothetical protein
MTDIQRPVHDPTIDPTTDTSVTEVPAAPIATIPLGSSPGTAATGPRRSRARWAAALGMVALIVGVTAIATLSLTGSSPASMVLGYVPTDSVAYGELRLDLPGDQRQEIGKFLSKFPGFADQAALDTKLDEVLDRLLSESTDGKQTYTRDIKPWFDGELGFSMGPLPADMSALKDPAPAAARGRALLLLSIKDEALARAWFTKVLAEAGTTSAQETYQGTELTVFSDLEVGAAQAAFALVDGKAAILGDVASVKAAIDTNGGSPLAKSDAFAAAKAALTGDDVGFMFVDLRTILDAAMALTESTASAPPINDAMLALVPDWAAFRLRVEGDALEMDGVMPHVDAAPGPAENHTNGVAAHAPPSTIALSAGNDYGATILEALAIYRQDPSMTEALKSLDQAIGIFGGPDKTFGWMGDTGVVIARSGESVEGGIVSIPADAAGGAQLLTTLRSFATLGGGQYGITVREEQHAGTTITIIDLGTAEDLAAMAALIGGSAAGGDGAFGGLPVPDDAAADLPKDRIEISYAATDGVVVIGSSPDFVKHVLDAGAGQSLADDPRFTGLLGRVGASHTGVSYVDITAARGLIEGLLAEATAKDRAEYEESVKPFLTPFDAFIASMVTGNDLEQQHAIITVK